MDISQKEDGGLVVTFRRNPNASEAEEWNTQLKAALKGKEKLAEVDLTPMTMVSSMGVNVIVGLYKHMQRQGGTVEVRVPNEKMRNVFTLFKLDQLFEVKVVETSA